MEVQCPASPTRTFSAFAPAMAPPSGILCHTETKRLVLRTEQLIERIFNTCAISYSAADRLDELVSILRNTREHVSEQAKAWANDELDRIEREVPDQVTARPVAYLDAAELIQSL